MPKDEFAKKLINQGMITGTSAYLLRVYIVLGSPEGGKENMEKLSILFSRSKVKNFKKELDEWIRINRSDKFLMKQGMEIWNAIDVNLVDPSDNVDLLNLKNGDHILKR